MNRFWENLIAPLAQHIRPNAILAVGLPRDLTENLRRWSETHGARLDLAAEPSGALLSDIRAELVLLANPAAEVIGRALNGLAQAAAADRPFPVVLVDLAAGGESVKEVVEAFVDREGGVYASALMPVSAGSRSCTERTVRSIRPRAP